MRAGPKLIVTLTGGIGSGKTTVSTLFSQLGVPLVDTDLLSRELVEPGAPALNEIRQTFGSDVVNPDGTLNRPALREKVFADTAARKQLESILHPRIRKLTRERLAGIDAPYAIVVIPLLLETGMDNPGDRILVVDVSESVQIARVLARDGVDEVQVRGILRAQCDRQRRLNAADEVIENNGSEEDLRGKVEQLHNKYLAMAQKRGTAS